MKTVPIWLIVIFFITLYTCNSNTKLRQDVDILERDVAGLREDVGAIKRDIADMRRLISDIDYKIDRVALRP